MAFSSCSGPHSWTSNIKAAGRDWILDHTNTSCSEELHFWNAVFHLVMVDTKVQPLITSLKLSWVNSLTRFSYLCEYLETHSPTCNVKWHNDAFFHRNRVTSIELSWQRKNVLGVPVFLISSQPRNKSNWSWRKANLEAAGRKRASLVCKGGGWADMLRANAYGRGSLCQEETAVVCKCRGHAICTMCSISALQESIESTFQQKWVSDKREREPLWFRPPLSHCPKS